jgi:hypothetical protein
VLAGIASRLARLFFKVKIPIAIGTMTLNFGCFEIQLYILIISIKYYFMLIVLKMNALIFGRKNSKRVKYGFGLMYN